MCKTPVAEKYTHLTMVIHCIVTNQNVVCAVGFNPYREQSAALSRVPPTKTGMWSVSISAALPTGVCVTQRSLDDLGSVAVAVSNHELGTDE